MFKDDSIIVSNSGTQIIGVRYVGTTEVAIQAAVDYANGLGGGSVFIEAGIYTVTNPINLYSNIEIYGEGEGSVLRSAVAVTGNNAVLMAVGTLGAEKENIFIHDLLIGNDVATAAGYRGIYCEYVGKAFTTGLTTGVSRYDSTTAGIDSVNKKGVTISGCIIQNNSSDGIYLNTSSNNTITANTVQNNSSSGINAYSSNNNTITGNVIQNNSSYGIYLSTSSNNTVTANTIQNNNGSGINLSTSSNNTITANTVQNNNNNGIQLNTSSNNNTITGNTVQNNNNNGVYLDASSNNTVTANTVQNNNGSGVYLNTSSNNTITGNTATANQSTAMQIDAGGNYNIYNGNIQNAITNAGTGNITTENVTV